MRAPPDRSTSVVIGTPSPRAFGSAATGTEYTLPLLPKPSSVSTVRHSNAPYSVSPALNVNCAGSWPMPVRARIQPFSEMMTVTGSSTTFCSATAFCASSISVRRASPNCLVSASISLMMARFIDAGLSSRSCSAPRSLRSSASSCWILIASSRTELAVAVAVGVGQVDREAGAVGQRDVERAAAGGGAVGQAAVGYLAGGGQLLHVEGIVARQCLGGGGGGADGRAERGRVGDHAFHVRQGLDGAVEAGHRRLQRGQRARFGGGVGGVGLELGTGIRLAFGGQGRRRAGRVVGRPERGRPGGGIADRGRRGGCYGRGHDRTPRKVKYT